MANNNRKLGKVAHCAAIDISMGRCAMGRYIQHTGTDRYTK